MPLTSLPSKHNGHNGAVSLRILLADDHILVRQGVSSLLRHAGHTVIGEAGDGREAASLAQDLCPDILLLEAALPLLNGPDAAKLVLRVSRHTKAIILTILQDPRYLIEAFLAGIKGYVLKTQHMDDLLQAIQEVSHGLVYICPDLAHTLLPGQLGPRLAPDPLSLREREILQLIAEGKTSKEISSLLGISTNTVESHRARLMQKLEVHHLAGLIRYAIRSGLVQA